MKKTFTILFAFVLVTGVLVQNAQAAVRYVTTSGAGLNDGTSWDNAYIGLQAALSVATSGDEIWVATGTYYPSAEVGGSGTRYQAFQMINGVAIYGGFDGTETAISQRTDYARGQTNETILSGDIGAVAYKLDNCYHVFYHPDGLVLSSNAILDGFTITYGNADGTSAAQFAKGGGMYNGNSSSPTINNCAFVLNNASGSGGGMANVGADLATVTSPTVTNCTFVLNSAVGAYGGGGGMYNAYSYPTVTNCLFTSNRGQTQNYCSGGGMYNYYSSPSLNNCTFSKNNFIHLGGAISNNRSSPTINNCIIWGNSAILHGNEFYVSGGTSYNTILNNSCYRNGIDDVYAVSNKFTPTNCITTDPQYVDATSNDFRIFGASPCADGGNDAYNSQSFDIRGASFGRKLLKTDAGTAGTIDMGAYEFNSNTDPINPTLYWNAGASTTDWNTAENWDGGVVPTSDYNVTILSSATNPVIGPAQSANCNNLVVESGATLTIQSDGTNSGSLIVNGTSSGNITYDRWMTTDKWHLVSAPVGGLTIASFVGTNTTYLATSDTKYGLATYNNETPGWTHFTSSNTPGSFDAGKGYETMRKTEDGTFAFTGTVATTDVSIGITSPVSPGNPWNLIGNPYLSALCANTPAQATNNLISINTDVLDAGAYQAIYVWDANASTPAYITVNQSVGATYIAPGQAFFVYSKTGGGDFSFTEAMQTHQTGDIFKNGQIQTPAINLIAESSASAASTHVKYIENMTAGLDPGYDGGRFSGGNNSFAVYTRLAGDETNLVDFDIQCLPADEFDHVIPVGLNAPENTEVVFKAQTENLPAGIPVYLEDRVTGTFTALHEPGSFYTVNIAAKTEGTGRFFLHTKSVATGIDPIANSSDFTIIPRPQNNSLRLIGSLDNAEIAVFDMAGRKLLNRNLNDTEMNDVDMGGLISGFYLVTVRSSTQRVSKKISWVKNQ